MVVFPNCKINLGLHILAKRNDGFHNLETVFYPVKIFDAVEVVQSTQFASSTSGLPATEQPSENSCVKAYELLRKDFSSLPAVKMHLHKTIPIGAGLGGGSADAAFTVRLLNEKLNLQLTREQLIHYAAQLGSDCPFFIINTPCFAGGRGEILEEIKIDLSNYKIAVVHPGIHIHTGWAFSQLKSFHPRSSLKEIIQLPVEQWKNALINDFEEVIFPHYPKLKKIKEDLYRAGAVYASMSGSGSALYGIFNSSPELNFSKDYLVKII